jgi:hypothetical protein
MCASDASATFNQNGKLKVANACKKTDGAMTAFEGEARSH